MNMDTILRTLGGVLGFQVLLAMVTWWPQGGSDAEPRDLVPTDAADLAKITIYPRTDATETESLVLEKKSGAWAIGSMFDYPAADRELDALFETIDAIKVRTPVSSQAYSHTKMDVASDKYTRKLELTDASGKLVTVYLGSSQGKAAHVRVEGDDDVYRVRGVSAALAERPTRYLDRDFQKIEVSSVRSLRIARPGVPPIEFVDAGGQWSLPGITPEGKAVDQAQATNFVRSTLNLRMLQPLGTQVTADMGFAEGVRVSWTEEQDDGTSLAGEYQVGAEVPDQSGQVYLKSSTTPYVFAGLVGQLQHATEKSVDDLFVDPLPAAPEAGLP